MLKLVSHGKVDVCLTLANFRLAYCVTNNNITLEIL